MSTPPLVTAFYDAIWNRGDLSATHALLTDAFVFRGSLGDELHGRDAFTAYVHMVRAALADYRCEVLDCVTEGDRAFAQMRFSGRHVGVLRGRAPTGASVHWLGAALFHLEGARIARLWVLGDLAGLDAQLVVHRESSPSS
ncbi:MAG: ester cyclase [Gemmatimonadaceae bacterium]|jgi:predicted ester cyclase|nr:ester cyclase [Gemmatimonadaceae bacterium]